MKKLFKTWILVGLFLSFFIPDIAFSQAGITNSGMTQQEETEMLRQQAGYGFDTGVKGGSALQQLENMTGTKISNSNANTRTVAPAVKTISSAAAFQNSMNMMVASSVASAFLNFIFSDNSKSNQQAVEAQRQQAALLAQRVAAEKRYNDSIAQAKYDQMMKSYKLLNDPNGLQIKTLSTGNLQFKSLDTQPAPMTMEERLRQNLLKRGLSVTWDYSSWANISPASNMIEETNTRQESEEDKQLDAIFSKHESEDGGREAAAAGRFMKNFKNETMSYLNDVSKAVGSGDMARIDELGQRDPAKIVSNTMKGTLEDTKNALIAEGKGKVIGFIKGANDAIIKNGVNEVAEEVVPKDVLGTWKVINNTYYK